MKLGEWMKGFSKQANLAGFTLLIRFRFVNKQVSGHSIDDRYNTNGVAENRPE